MEDQEHLDLLPPEQTPPTEQLDIQAAIREVKDQTAAIYQGALADRERRIQEYESRIASLENASRTPKQEVTGVEFLEKPNAHVRDIVSQVLQEQLAPLAKVTQRIESERVINNTKAQLAHSNSGLKNILDTYGDVVDQILSSQGVVNEQTVYNAVIAIPGLVAAGQVPSRNAPATNVDGSPKSSKSPPPTLTSAPTAPKKAEAEKEIVLPDDEENARRRSGLSKSEWVRLRDVDSNVLNFRLPTKKA